MWTGRNPLYCGSRINYDMIWYDMIWYDMIWPNYTITPYFFNHPSTHMCFLIACCLLADRLMDEWMDGLPVFLSINLSPSFRHHYTAPLATVTVKSWLILSTTEPMPTSLTKMATGTVLYSNHAFCTDVFPLPLTLLVFIHTHTYPFFPLIMSN